MSKFLYKIVKDDENDAGALILTSYLEDGYSIMKCVPTSTGVHYILVKWTFSKEEQ